MQKQKPIDRFDEHVKAAKDRVYNDSISTELTPLQLEQAKASRLVGLVIMRDIFCPLFYELTVAVSDRDKVISKLLHADNVATITKQAEEIGRLRGLLKEFLYNSGFFRGNYEKRRYGYDGTKITKVIPRIEAALAEQPEHKEEG